MSKRKAPAREVVESRGPIFDDGFTYRLMRVNCGNCKACAAGSYNHGPYWYACVTLPSVVRINAKGQEKVYPGRTKTIYIGRKLMSVRARRQELADKAKAAKRAK